MGPTLRCAASTAALCFFAFGCSKKARDAELEKQLVGAWSFDPREQLPPEAIDDVAFITPDRIILEIGPATMQSNGGRLGRYVRYQHLPSIGEHRARWESMRGNWYVLDGELTLQGRDAKVAVKATPGRLKMEGLLRLPCRGGCSMTRIAAVPLVPKYGCNQPAPFPRDGVFETCLSACKSDCDCRSLVPLPCVPFPGGAVDEETGGRGVCMLDTKKSGIPCADAGRQ